MSFGCERNPYKQGKTLFSYYCASCHMDDGSGLAALIPPLDSTNQGLTSAERLICTIKNGMPLNTSTGQSMPPNTALSETELNNLVNYIGFRFRSIPQWVTTEQSQKMYGACQSGDQTQ